MSCCCQVVGQGVRGGEGGAHGVLQGPEVVPRGARAAVARGAAAGPHRRRRRGRRQLHQEEACLPAQVSSRALTYVHYLHFCHIVSYFLLIL